MVLKETYYDYNYLTIILENLMKITIKFLNEILQFLLHVFMANIKTFQILKYNNFYKSLLNY